MSYDAVIFDLYGTLMDAPPQEEYERHFRELAHVLGAPQEEFRQAWRATPRGA